MHVYVIVTPQKVHVYGSHARALAVFTEAERRGAKGLEFVQADVRAGSTAKQRKAAAESERAWPCGKLSWGSVVSP